MKMSMPEVRSFGYLARRLNMSVFSPAMCIVFQGRRHTSCLALVTSSKSEAGNDLANRARQMKSSKYLPRKVQSLVLLRSTSACSVSLTDNKRRSQASSRRSRTVMYGRSAAESTTRE